MKPNVEQWVDKQKWENLVREAFPVNISDIYSYEEAMQIVAHIFLAYPKANSELRYRMCEFMITLLSILRAKYPDKWKVDWQNEAFLGDLCTVFGMREEEGFQYTQNAIRTIQDPPAALILAYIRAGTCPPFYLSGEEVAQLSKEAVEKELTAETAYQMVSVTDDLEWQHKAEEAEKANIHTEYITPEVMKPVFKQTKK